MIPERHVMVLLCALCVCINYADRVNMSVGIIAIAEDHDFSIESQGIIMSSFFVGYIPMQIGGAILCRRFGAKAVLAYAAFLWSMFTVLTPFACKAGFYVLLLCRVAMGLAEGVAFPGVYHFLSTWVPSNERSRSISLLMTGVHVGTTVALVVSPIIIREYSWQVIFYSFGALGLLWIAVWILVAYDRDDKKTRGSGSITNDDRVAVGDEGNSDVEQELLVPETTMTSRNSTNSASFDAETALPGKTSLHGASSIIPLGMIMGRSSQYLSPSERRAITTILTNKKCLAICIVQAVFSLIHYTILSWLPSYFKHVFGTKTTSLSFTFVPYFSMALSANIGGLVADALLHRGFSLVQVRKLISTVVNVCAAIMLLLFTMAQTVTSSLFFISLSLAFMSCNTGGFESSYLDLASPGLVGIFKAVSNTMGSFAGLIAIPFSTLVLRWAGGSWRIMFASLTLCYAVTVGVFQKWGSAERILLEDGGTEDRRDKSRSSGLVA